MILDRLGKLQSGATALAAGAVDSDNVIQTAALDFASLTDLWWVVKTAVAPTVAGTTSTFKFDLVLSQEATLDTNVEVLSRTVTSTASKCLVANRNIININVGKMLKDLLETDGSSYPYIGMIITLVDGNGNADLQVEAALSPSEPRTDDHAQVVTSNVGVPAKCSAGS
jgi:hypothetical protein